MTIKDREILRKLATEQMEIASSPAMDKLVREWYEHNDLNGKRTMILFDKGGISVELLPILMKCEDEDARNIERQLILNTLNAKYFGDDSVVNPYFSLVYEHEVIPYGIEEKVERSDGIGHHFISQIFDLDEDFDKLKKSTITYDTKDNINKKNEFAHSIFGDILPIKHVGRATAMPITQKIVHIMDMEDMYIAMIDTPELFVKMMDMLADDYIEFLDYQEKNGLFMPTTHSEHLNQGTYCFTKQLPNQGALKCSDTWGFMDSQETVSISPQMYEELIFPYYKKVSDKFGLLSYGCCEPVEKIYDSCLSKMKNLRKLSISAWCDEEAMGEKLKDKDTIYLRKPSANFLAVDRHLNDDAVREHIKRTVKAAKDCKLEIVQRDVPTIHCDMAKLKRYIEIIREETMR